MEVASIIAFKPAMPRSPSPRSASFCLSALVMVAWRLRFIIDRQLTRCNVFGVEIRYSHMPIPVANRPEIRISDVDGDGQRLAIAAILAGPMFTVLPHKEQHHAIGARNRKPGREHGRLRKSKMPFIPRGFSRRPAYGQREWIHTWL